MDVTILVFGLVAAEPMATTDEERDRLAEALALHSGALELAEGDHPEAQALPGHEPHVDALHQLLQELPARQAA